MVYTSKKTSYRRRYRKYGRSNNATKSYVNKVVKSAMAAEVHYKDIVLSDSSVPTADTGALTVSLGQVQQGDSQTSRSGKQIAVRSLQIKGNAYRDPASTTHDRVRMILFWVKRRDRLYDIRDVIQTANLVGNRQTDVQAMRRMDTGIYSNFIVLRDWMIDLGYTNSSKVTRTFSYYKKFKKPLVSTFLNSTDIYPQDGELVLSMISDSGSGNPLLGFTSRILFSP